MALDAALAAFGHLVFEQRGQEAGRLPAFLVRALGELGPQPPDRGQPQFIEHQRQACRLMGEGVHADTTAASKAS